MKNTNLILSTVTLVLANAVPLYGVLYLGWSVELILFLFWLENFIIWYFTILKLNLKKNNTKENKTDSLVFFALHYGGFTFVHGLFIFIVFAPEIIFTSYSLYLSAFALFFSHLLSHYLNFVGKKEYLFLSEKAILLGPYTRILPIHIATILGAVFLTSSYESQVLVMTILIGIKILFDVGLHIFSHTARIKTG